MSQRRAIRGDSRVGSASSAKPLYSLTQMRCASTSNGGIALQRQSNEHKSRTPTSGSVSGRGRLWVGQSAAGRACPAGAQRIDGAAVARMEPREPGRQQMVPGRDHWQRRPNILRCLRKRRARSGTSIARKTTRVRSQRTSRNAGSASRAAAAAQSPSGTRTRCSCRAAAAPRSAVN